MKTFPAFFGTIGIVLGMTALRFAWRRKTRMHSWIILGGWMIILGGLFLWGQVGSADWGIALGILLFICLAMIILGFNAWPAFVNRDRKPPPIPRTNDSQISDQTPRGVYVKHLSTFFLAAPIGGGIAVILTLSVFELFQTFGVDSANGIVVTFFLTPFLWATIATWMVIDATIKRKTTLLFCFAALSALHLAWVQ